MLIGHAVAPNASSPRVLFQVSNTLFSDSVIATWRHRCVTNRRAVGTYL